jgi:hypothetical protein
MIETAYVLISEDDECPPTGDLMVDTSMILYHYMEKEIALYRRFCHCVLDRGIDIVAKKLRRETPALILRFTREEFFKDNLEFTLMRDIVLNGEPNPGCELCGGSGVFAYAGLPSSLFDYWDYDEMDDEFRACMTVNHDDDLIIPIQDIDLDKIPVPNHVFTPDGECYSQEQLLFFHRIIVWDPNWESTFKTVLREHESAGLVLAKIHV